MVSTPEAAGPPVVKDIGVEEFAKLIGTKDRVLIDVRTPSEISMGKIPGAQELDFNGPDFESKMKSLAKDKEYLLYCRSGNRSGQAARMMQKEGFPMVYNLDGGYLDWTNQEDKAVQ
ncbi:MAG: rhodanese-like domain-containing protein [Saprospiraceae bacterium]|nr:rhodanese-like domain-containing protein [Saprospiraceae bacterium]